MGHFAPLVCRHYSILNWSRVDLMTFQTTDLNVFKCQRLHWLFLQLVTWKSSTFCLGLRFVSYLGLKACLLILVLRISEGAFIKIASPPLPF